MWQYGVSSLDLSGPLHQERESQLNRKVSERIQESDIAYLNLLEVNYVSNDGYKIYEALQKRITAIDHLRGG